MEGTEVTPIYFRDEVRSYLATKYNIRSKLGVLVLLMLTFLSLSKLSSPLSYLCNEKAEVIVFSGDVLF